MKTLTLLAVFLIVKISAFLPAAHAYFAEIYFQAYSVKDETKQAEFMFGVMSYWLTCKDVVPTFFSKDDVPVNNDSIKYLKAANGADNYFEKGKLYHAYIVNKLSWAESEFKNRDRIKMYLTEKHDALLYILDEMYSTIRSKMLCRYRLEKCHENNLDGWRDVNYSNLYTLVDYLTKLPTEHIKSIAWKEEQYDLKRSEYYKNLVPDVEIGLRDAYISEFAHFLYEEYVKDIVQIMYEKEST